MDAGTREIRRTARRASSTSSSSSSSSSDAPLGRAGTMPLPPAIPKLDLSRVTPHDFHAHAMTQMDSPSEDAHHARLYREPSEESNAFEARARDDDDVVSVSSSEASSGYEEPVMTRSSSSTPSRALVRAPTPPPRETETASSSSPAVRDLDPECLEMFKTLDRGGDGAVNVRELIIALRFSPAIAAKLNLPTRVRQEDGTRDAIEAFFRALDVNDDRSLSLEEFAAVFASQVRPIHWSPYDRVRVVNADP